MMVITTWSLELMIADPGPLKFDATQYPPEWRGQVSRDMEVDGFYFVLVICLKCTFPIAKGNA